MSTIASHSSFRDKISTVDASGKRIWLYPRQPNGRFYDYRKVIGYILILVLFIMPFIQVAGRPLMLFNIPDLEFIILGQYFAPHDFHIFVIAMLIGILFIALFTVVYGRVFCGWVCPQTVFMELVFRPIEYIIEGTFSQQKKLNKRSWDLNKTMKKGLKHALFILISVLITHTFLAYVIGVERVWSLLFSPISESIGIFIAMVVLTGMFYGVFAFMREQVCTTICPYGRMQSVLVDDDSLAITYDFKRGEPRTKYAKKKKNTLCKDCGVGNGCKSIAQKLITDETSVFQLSDFGAIDTAALAESRVGDCVDCHKCVQVCPTGIDIRNGIQLECVNCTACMDACDEVMIKLGKPTGLIRIDSYNNIKNGTRKLFTSRAKAYSVVLVILMVLESFLFVAREPVEVLLLRTPGLLYQEIENDSISNMYNFEIVNKSDDLLTIEFRAEEGFSDVDFEIIGKSIIARPRAKLEGVLFMKVKRHYLKGRNNEIGIEVWSDNQKITTTSTSFYQPTK